MRGSEKQMDYRRWGGEYLTEARRLKKRVDLLRRRLKEVSGNEEVLLFRRAAMLEAMYLECLHTGLDLTGRAEKIEAERKAEP